MNDTIGTRVPRHLWVVGILALLWNGIGAFDYAATQFRWQPYMSQFTPEQLAYFYGFPAWATAAWAIAVWSAVIASAGLLLRRSWAWAFQLLGWSAITLRFWLGLFDAETSISYAGAVGLVLLAVGAVLEAMRK